MIIKVDNINKYYTKKHVIKNLSFSIKPGVIFGLIGPNGAGKTTLLRILTRIIHHDSGRILFNNKELNESHKIQIGYMPEERGLYKNMKVYEHLVYFSELYNLDAKEAKESINNWLKALEIEEARDKKVKELSKGMSQKIQFITTVLHHPTLLILDEPFSGLDPISTELLEKALIDLKEKHGTTIILSTHRMEQIEHLCESVLLINNGQKVVEGEVNKLRRQFSNGEVRVDFEGTLPCLNDFLILNKQNNQLNVRLIEKSQKQKLLSSLIQDNLIINKYEEVYPSLREIFLQKTGLNE